jgi:hypothetical protein
VEQIASVVFEAPSSADHYSARRVASLQPTVTIKSGVKSTWSKVAALRIANNARNGLRSVKEGIEECRYITCLGGQHGHLAGIPAG